MKPLFCATAMLFAAMGAHGVAEAQGPSGNGPHLLASVSRKGDMALSVNTAHIRTEGKYKFAWVTMHFLQPVGTKQIIHSLEKIDCQVATTQRMHTIATSPNGKQNSWKNTTSEALHIMPGTVMYTLYEVVCHGASGENVRFSNFEHGTMLARTIFEAENASGG
jgi:hypothetical protein